MTSVDLGAAGSAMPTYSVVIPNYDHAHYLGAALQAYLSQTVPPLEIIVVDDASTDESCDLVERVAAGGVDEVSLINTYVGMAIDVKTRKPYLKNLTGGLSGPCIRPLAVRLVWEAARAVKIPVIGMGGIMTTRDAIEFMIAGASCVQVGTATFIKPAVCPEIIQGIETFMKKEKIKVLSDLVGSIQNP